MKSKQLSGARIWAALAVAMDAYMEVHGRMSSGNLLRCAMAGQLGPVVVSTRGRPLRERAVVGVHFDPILSAHETELVLGLAKSAGTSPGEFVTRAVCQFLGTPFIQGVRWTVRASDAPHQVSRGYKRDASPRHLDRSSRWPAGHQIS